MPSLTRKTTKTGTRLRVLATFAAAASLTLALSGCTKLETHSPSSVRNAADARAADGKADGKADASGTQARAGGLGTVDCAHTKCIALTFDAGPSENSARLLDILKE